jgi:NAD-dependent DNA ligase
MRQKALEQGYTFNEHGIYHLLQNKKGEKVQKYFESEKDIFTFLGLQYKKPSDRKDARDVLPMSLKDTNASETGGTTVELSAIKAGTTVELSAIKAGTTVELSATELIKRFVKEGIPVLKNLNESQLSNMLRFASKQYFNHSQVMTDNQYDILKNLVEELYPSNPVVSEVGADVERNKVKLPYLMASMNKIKPDTGALACWKEKHQGPYVLSCKLDGVSGLYTTEGDTAKLYTRGNGIIGQDISHLIPYLRLPKKKNMVIRGEFIISKAIFTEKYQKKFANPRNMVSGIINQKSITESIGDLKFVAYEAIKPIIKPSEQMDFIKSLDIESNLYFTANVLANEMLSELLIKWRTSHTYEIDGVIVTNDKIYERKSSGNPEHAFAFKMVLSDQIAEAVVTDVIWTPSKDGYLKPRVQIEPLQLGGVKIEYATGFNAAFIEDNKIGVGATIQLIRSGDVIPHIKSITVPAPVAKMPNIPFKWNDTHVDIMLEDLSLDPTVKEKNITGFFKGIGVEGLSSGNISRIIDAGYDTVPKIIAMKEQDFLKIEGFKQKMANKLYTGIREKLEESQLVTLMAASNIFGRGFSDKKIELILNELPDILVTNKYKSKAEKVNAIASIKGMADKTAESFVAKIDEFIKFMTETGLLSKIVDAKTQIDAAANEIINKNHPLYNKTIVLTGTRDKKVIDFLKSVGAVQGQTVNKNTYLVVAKTVDDDTGKAEEARKLNIPIISVSIFVAKYIN